MPIKSGNRSLSVFTEVFPDHGEKLRLSYDAILDVSSG